MIQKLKNSKRTKKLKTLTKISTVILAATILFGCKGKCLREGAEIVIATKEDPEISCKFLGSTIGEQGGSLTGHFTSNKKLAFGAFNDLKNNAFEKDANFAKIENIHEGYSLGSETDVTYTANLYNCPNQKNFGFFEKCPYQDYTSVSFAIPLATGAKYLADKQLTVANKVQLNADFGYKLDDYFFPTFTAGFTSLQFGYRSRWIIPVAFKAKLGWWSEDWYLAAYPMLGIFLSLPGEKSYFDFINSNADSMVEMTPQTFAFGSMNGAGIEYCHHINKNLGIVASLEYADYNYSYSEKVVLFKSNVRLGNTIINREDSTLKMGIGVVRFW